MHDSFYGIAGLTQPAVDSGLGQAGRPVRRFSYLVGQLRQAPAERFSPGAGQTAPRYDDHSHMPRTMVPPAVVSLEPHEYAEADRCLTQQLVEESFQFAQTGDTWRTIAQRVNPELCDRDLSAFATYLKHINGNRNEPKGGDLIATRSTQEIESMVRVQLTALFKRAELRGF